MRTLINIAWIPLAIILGTWAYRFLQDYKLVPRFEGPHIALESPCPACGNRGCNLKFDPQLKKVNRICQHCGCSVTQPPVMPDLFELKK